MPASDSVRLVVVVPVYGNWEDVLQCLGALHNQSVDAFHVLVSDDGSPEPPPPAVREFANSSYCRHDNLGFAGNCNYAAQRAIELGATHVLFLNSDTTFSDGFIAAWLRALAEDSHSILAPVIYWHHRPTSVWYSGGPMSILVPFARHTRNVDRPTLVDIVTGCALCVPVHAWRQLGGFDVRYVTYFEDFDLCCRARDAGIAICVQPEKDLRVWHRVPASFRRRGRWQRHYRFLHSQILFIRAHYSGLRLAACCLLAFGHLLGSAVAYLPQLPSWRRLARAVRNTNGIV